MNHWILAQNLWLIGGTVARSMRISRQVTQPIATGRWPALPSRGLQSRGSFSLTTEAIKERRHVATLTEASLDAAQWRHEVIDVTLHVPPGGTLDYVGEALVSSPAQGCSLEFAFHTTLRRRATLDIPLFVSAP